jgi:DinB family protein
VAKIEQPPLPLGAIRDGAVAELDHLSTLLANLSVSEWSRPSAVDGWTIGDVATHLDVFLGVYSRFLTTAFAGGGSHRVAKAIGWLIGSIMPTAAPIFDMINGYVPKTIDRVLASGAVKRQFVAGARKTRQHLLEIGPDDYARPIHFEGGSYPLSFYLAIIVNELAIHGWDIESKINPDAGLGRDARYILPWFYWGGTRLMFRPRRNVAGIVQVSLTNPASAMWWSLSRGVVNFGREGVSHPDTEIQGPSGDYLLALTGRLKAADVLHRLLTVNGDHTLAASFLSSWHLI